MRLECTTGGSNKFWEINIENETETEISYGAIGATPRLSHKDHGSAEKAEKFMTSEIQKKKKKGYVEVKAADETPKEPDSKKPKVESTSTTIRLECTAGGHNKFWEISVDGNKTTVSYGAIGATPRTSEKTHASAAAAEKFKLKMLGSKKKEGYQEVGGKADGAASKDEDGTLFTFGAAVTPAELEKRRDDWDTDEVMDVCRDDIKHGVMSDAPAASKAVAEELNSSMPSLEEIAIVPGSEGSDGGEVIVIACARKDAKAACLKGLKFTKEMMEEYESKAAVKNVDFKKFIHKGFNLVDKPGFSPMGEADTKDYLSENEDAKKLMVGTKIMAEKLTDHFVFAISGRGIVVAPFIFGGFASDGNIVGILSSAVTT